MEHINQNTAQSAPLQTTLNRLTRLGTEREVSLRDVMEAIGPSSRLPLLMFLGLMLVSPLSGVPLFSTIVGLTIALTAAQSLIGMRRIALPGIFANREIGGRRLARGLARMRGAARWLDGIAVVGRIGWLASPPTSFAIKTLIVLIGLMFPFLELIPFSSSFFGGAIALMALGLFVHDGLLVIFGLTLASLAAAIPVTVAVQLAG